MSSYVTEDQHPPRQPRLWASDAATKLPLANQNHEMYLSSSVCDFQQDATRQSAFLGEQSRAQARIPIDPKSASRSPAIHASLEFVVNVGPQQVLRTVSREALSSGQTQLNSAAAQQMAAEEDDSEIKRELKARVQRAAAHFTRGERTAAQRELRAIAEHGGPAAAAALRDVSRSLRAAASGTVAGKHPLLQTTQTQRNRFVSSTAMRLRIAGRMACGIAIVFTDGACPAFGIHLSFHGRD